MDLRMTTLKATIKKVHQAEVTELREQIRQTLHLNCTIHTPALPLFHCHTMREDCACLQGTQCQPTTTASDIATITSTGIIILDPDITSTNYNEGTPGTGTLNKPTISTDSQPMDLTTTASDLSSPDTHPQSPVPLTPTDEDTPSPAMLDQYAQNI